MSTPAAIVLSILLAGAPPSGSVIRWETWSPELFERARAEGRFVLLDLEAVWCHWCHVMDEITYRDETVVRLIGAKYLAVRVDQDSAPELSNRYEDYGWPATIVFAADGSEIVRRRGYINPRAMAAMLQAIIDDPSPGPSVTAVDQPREPRGTSQEGGPGPARKYGGEPPPALAAIAKNIRDNYDHRHGGWGTLHKYLDPDNTEWAIENAPELAQETLAKNIALLDPVWGGVYQYSDRRKPDDPWGSPHYEKIMSFQAANLRLYSLAYARWKKPEHLAAARAIDRYLENFLTAPDARFYTSQDADPPTREGGLTADQYFALPDAERRELGLPRIDTNIYPRENGWAIAALAAFSDATGDRRALHRALRAAHAISIFRDRPYLGDVLAAGRAFLALYTSTGDRRWLEAAISAAAELDKTFRDRRGFITAVPDPKAIGVHAEPVRQIEENVEVARFSSILSRYSGSGAHRAIAEHALRWLESPEVAAKRRTFAGLLLARAEHDRDPLHVVIVGRADDARTTELFDAARALPVVYKRLERWDPRGPRLLHHDVEYPILDRPAAFLCDRGVCSAPIFDPAKLVVRR